jgi:hypothetical protein
MKKKAEFLKTSILNERPYNIEGDLGFNRNTGQRIPIITSNFVESNKVSNVSLAEKG